MGAVAKKARAPKPPRAPQSGTRAVQAPQKRSGSSPRASSTSGGSRRPLYWALGIIGALLVAGGIAGIVVASSGKSKPEGYALRGAISWNNLPGLQTSKPPWPANTATLPTRLPSLGLQALSQEQLAFHIHQHLDLYVDGKHTSVPRYIGIFPDQSSQTGVSITEVHTHYTDGIVHVESAQALKYVLGQFFGEWGVRLTSQCMGSFTGSCANLRWWVNGVRQRGNPAKLVLKPHQEIVISVGRPVPSHIPSSYSFPQGY